MEEIRKLKPISGQQLNVPLSNSLYEKLVNMFNDMECECRTIAAQLLMKGQDGDN